MTRLGASLLAALTLVVSSAAAADGSPSRAEYVKRVEPICARASTLNERILEGARSRVKDGEMAVAGRQFVRASIAFGKTVERIAAIPRPEADEGQLVRWVGLLQRVGGDLRKIGVALKDENEVRANHDAIRAERTGNDANNVVFAFEFDHCRFRSVRVI